MKNIIAHLDKAFESRVRLGIMSMLMVNYSVDFKTIKETLDVSDGNLASHLTALEKKEYIIITKQFIERKPNTSYSLSVEGKAAFQKHLKALEALIGK
ncbi:transcriptional regulator [Crocinitomicaceae bacterium]|nr:transcriptional regulator [Crocinitomicaceae bacterium]MDC0257682.1 transcriptional regulator [Crocinitomicaceae bacterium]